MGTIFSLAKSRMKNNIKVVKNDHKYRLTSYVYAVRFNVTTKSLKNFARLTANVSYFPQAHKGELKHARF